MTTNRKRHSSVLSKLQKITEKKLSLGAAIESIRKGEEMTQQVFAEHIGVSKQYLCDLEKGRRAVRPAKAAEYARKLGYCEKQFVRLCLQDMLDRAGLKLIVKLEVNR